MAEEKRIDISGLDKELVLLALYDKSHTQGMGFLQAVDSYTLDDARRDFETSTDKYFDYLHGRVLKVDLSGDSFDPRLFDRDNYEGAAEDAIDFLRYTKDKNTCSHRNSDGTSAIKKAQTGIRCALCGSKFNN